MQLGGSNGNDNELPQALLINIKDIGGLSFDMPTDVHLDLFQVIKDHELLCFSQ